MDVSKPDQGAARPYRGMEGKKMPRKSTTRPPKVSNEQVVAMATPPAEDLSLPELRFAENGHAKVAIYVDFKSTPEGQAALARWKSFGDEKFPMGALVRTVANGVQDGSIKPSGRDGDKQIVRMNVGLVNEAYASYAEFRRTCPVGREDGVNSYRRTANFLLSVKERNGELDLSEAEEKVRLAHRIIQANALTPKRDYRRVMNLLNEAAEMIQKTSLDDVTSKIHTFGERAGQTAEAVEAAIATATEGPAEEHFGKLMGVLHSLRNAAYDVDAIAARRRDNATQRHQQQGRGGKPGGRFARRHTN